MSKRKQDLKNAFHAGKMYGMITLEEHPDFKDWYKEYQSKCKGKAIDNVHTNERGKGYRRDLLRMKKTVEAVFIRVHL